VQAHHHWREFDIDEVRDVILLKNALDVRSFSLVEREHLEGFTASHKLLGDLSAKVVRVILL